MTHIPLGNSEVTISFQMPSPGGSRLSAIVFGVGASPDADLLDAIVESYNETVWFDLGTDDGTIVSARMTDGIEIAEGSYSLPGNHSGDRPPPNVSLLVRKVTGLGGRQNQGRMYPPGLIYDNTYDDSGVMSAGSQSDYNDCFANFLIGLDTLEAPMVLLHSAEIGATAITRLSTELVASTQRRRLRR